MPAEMEAESPTQNVRVAVAPVVELAFSLYVAEKKALQLGAPQQAWVRSLQDERPGLLTRVASFWATGGYYEWAELLILAHRSGTLLSPAEELFARLDATALQAYQVPELPAESEGVREILQDRLDRLAASPALRERYLALLREFWDALEPAWDGGAEKLAGEMVISYSQQIARAKDIRDVLPKNHFARRSINADVVDRAVKSGDAVVVPLALGGVGIAFFALPGAVIIAFGPDTAKRQARRREASERAAGKFKLLSDPTRLAILISFCNAPASISDLANFFDLSQPTVSVHVKMLREAGLLDATKVRGQTLYHSSQEKVSELVNTALSEIFTA